MKSRSKVPKVKCLVFYDPDSPSIDMAGRGHISLLLKIWIPNMLIFLYQCIPVHSINIF